MHKIFNIPNTVGLASVIGLDVDLSDAICHSSVRNLSVLPSGQVPPDPSELLSSNLFQELINTVREKFDYVLIDTGPVLAISDPSVVATQVDGVILALNISKNSRAQVKRVHEVLTNLGANVLGVFVNGGLSKGASAYDYGGHYNYESDDVADDRYQDSESSRQTSLPVG